MFPKQALSDGIYRLTISESILPGNPFQWDGSADNRFFVLKGDWDGNGVVNLDDFHVYGYWTDPLTNSVPLYLDLDDSGTVDRHDLTEFEASYSRFVRFPDGTDRSDLATSQQELESSIASLTDPFDTNGDQKVSGLDALGIINFLSVAEDLPPIPWSPLDLNRDGRISALDALLVINRMGEIQVGEPELLPPVPADVASSLDDPVDENAIDQLMTLF